jgi:hypothetical protein
MSQRTGPFPLECNSPLCPGRHVKVTYAVNGMRAVQKGATGFMCVDLTGEPVASREHDGVPLGYVRWLDTPERAQQQHGDYPKKEFDYAFFPPRLTTTAEADAWLDANTR